MKNKSRKTAFDTKFRNVVKKQYSPRKSYYYTYDFDCVVGETITYFSKKGTFSGKIELVKDGKYLIKWGNKGLWVEVR